MFGRRNPNRPKRRRRRTKRAKKKLNGNPVDMTMPKTGGRAPSNTVPNGSTLLPSTYGPGGTGDVVRSVTRTVVPSEVPDDTPMTRVGLPTSAERLNSPTAIVPPGPVVRAVANPTVLPPQVTVVDDVARANQV